MARPMALREPPWRWTPRQTDGTVVCTLDSKHLPRWDGQWWGLGKQPNQEQAHSVESKGLELQPGPWARSSWHPWGPFYTLCAMVGKEGEHLDPHGAPATSKAALDGTSTLVSRQPREIGTLTRREAEARRS